MSKNVLGTGYLSLQVLSDGITTSAAPPENPSVGTGWLDANYSPAVYKFWNGVVWEVGTIDIAEADPKASEKIEEALEEARKKSKTIYSETPPETPSEGDTWYSLNAAGNVGAVKIWKEGEWVDKKFDLTALSIEELHAISIFGGVISGSEFLHTVNHRDEDGNLYSGAVRMDDDGFTSSTYLPTGLGSTVLESVINTLGGYKIAQKLIDDKGEGVAKDAMLTASSLIFSESGNIKLSIDADSFYKTIWKDLPLNAGYSTAEFNTPQYMILCIFGIRIVFFRGQVQKSTAWASANAFASVPLEIQTTRTAMAYAPTSKSTGGRVHASSANAMSFMPVDTSVTYFALNQLFYVLD
ncbi:TPA_asm: hypothetical protein GJA55_07900 [Listeria monocytogenes]|uniref:Carbohydrate-binding protein CenC n=17 Tax=Listeria monocytogenes TaxID=1639 RepID=A0A9P1UCZ1_LISMN|nr:hypothetical protein [Listeria monocytogenes]EAA0377412.1 hypothetical protein [Listeria monocytogenes]EAC2897615.1 hypothetical protein [Listeria monocytogenes]EAC4802106.1 hypothetical protein [Listeria monocytogenes]EAC5825027.1 hypothetical protein [Listeria monocytogenes]EAC6055178.1 hypothetical protein [Listeria monocytogenes]